MTSLEALTKIDNYHNEEVYDLGGTYVENVFSEEIKAIREDLERLERLEEVANILSWCPKALKALKEETNRDEYEMIMGVIDNGKVD